MLAAVALTLAGNAGRSGHSRSTISTVLSPTPMGLWRMAWTLALHRARLDGSQTDKSKLDCESKTANKTGSRPDRTSLHPVRQRNLKCAVALGLTTSHHRCVLNWSSIFPSASTAIRPPESTGNVVWITAFADALRDSRKYSIREDTADAI